LTGQAPETGSELVFFASRAFPAIEFSFRDERSGRTEFHLCLPGEECPGVALRADAPRPSPVRFVPIGFEHVAPEGADHVLFVVGLFLGVRGLGALIAQTLAFTGGHSVTLGLSTLGILGLSSDVVEPLIALSIGLVGFLNLAALKDGSPRGEFSTRDGLKSSPEPRGLRGRIVLAFAFGLLHGLGFASAFAASSVSRDELFAALLFFNVGVEAGQLAVIAAALLATSVARAWTGDESLYRARLARPLSALLGVLGVAWAGQRVLGG
jgi:hypothetical protein